jgi:hypothetical protein
LFISYCLLYIVYFILFIILFISYCLLYIVYFILFIILFIIYCLLYIVYFILFIILFIIYCLLYIVHNILFIVYCCPTACVFKVRDTMSHFIIRSCKSCLIISISCVILRPVPYPDISYQ